MGAVGTFDELLAKARFKEARIKEIESKWKDSFQPVSVAPRPKTSQSPADSKKPRPPLGRSEVTCYIQVWRDWTFCSGVSPQGSWIACGELRGTSEEPYHWCWPFSQYGAEPQYCEREGRC